MSGKIKKRSLIAGKYGNVRCVKSPGDGSGVIAATR
jgi:hypothetical protein